MKEEMISGPFQGTVIHRHHVEPRVKLYVPTTCDTSESIATRPPGSDLDDDQIRKMLASPLFIQEREKQVLTDHEFITPSEKTRCPVHLTPRVCAGKLAALFSLKRKSVQVTFSDRDGISSGHQRVQGK